VTSSYLLPQAPFCDDWGLVASRLPIDFFVSCTGEASFVRCLWGAGRRAWPPRRPANAPAGECVARPMRRSPAALALRVSPYRQTPRELPEQASEASDCGRNQSRIGAKRRFCEAEILIVFFPLRRALEQSPEAKRSPSTTPTVGQVERKGITPAGQRRPVCPPLFAAGSTYRLRLRRRLS